MYQLTMAPGAWGPVGRLLIFRVHWAYFLVFIPYGWLVSFTVIRVISALFLKQVITAAAVDPVAVMNEKARKKKRELDQLQDLFSMADQNGNGEMDQEEFRALMEQPMARTILSILEIDPTDAKHVFTVLDDGDGEILMSEFISGVMRVRGHAKALDMVTVLYQNQRMQAQMDRLEELLGQLHDRP